SLMWALAWPNSNGNTMRGLCPRWDAQAVMATRWNMSIKRHSPPAGRYVQANGIQHIDAGLRRAIGGKRLHPSEVRPCLVRRLVVLTALGIKHQRTARPPHPERGLHVEDALAAACGSH